jgi:hypothetical protein
MREPARGVGGGRDVTFEEGGTQSVSVTSARAAVTSARAAPTSGATFFGVSEFRNFGKLRHKFRTSEKIYSKSLKFKNFIKENLGLIFYLRKLLPLLR